MPAYTRPLPAESQLTFPEIAHVLVEATPGTLQGFDQVCPATPTRRAPVTAAVPPFILNIRQTTKNPGFRPCNRLTINAFSYMECLPIT